MRISTRSESFIFYALLGGIAALVSQLFLISRIVRFGDFFYVFIVLPLAILSVTSLLYLDGDLSSLATIRKILVCVSRNYLRICYFRWVKL